MPQHPTHGPSDCADLPVPDLGHLRDVIASAEALVRSDAASAEALAWQVVPVCEAGPLNDIAGRAQHVLGLARACQRGPAGSTVHLPVIAMPAHALRGDRERFLAAGFDGAVSKPFRDSDRVSEAQRVLALRARALG